MPSKPRYDCPARELADKAGVTTQYVNRLLTSLGVPFRQVGRLKLYHRQKAMQALAHRITVAGAGDTADAVVYDLPIREFAELAGINRQRAHVIATELGLPCQWVNDRLMLLSRPEAMQAIRRRERNGTWD